MRYDKNYAYFKPHFDWYTFEKGVGYVPTDKAPKKAIEAMEKYNSYTFKKLHFLDNGLPTERTDQTYDRLAEDVVARFRKYCKALNKTVDELTKQELDKFYRTEKSYDK